MSRCKGCSWIALQQQLGIWSIGFPSNSYPLRNTGDVGPSILEPPQLWLENSFDFGQKHEKLPDLAERFWCSLAIQVLHYYCYLLFVYIITHIYIYILSTLIDYINTLVWILFCVLFFPMFVKPKCLKLCRTIQGHSPLKPAWWSFRSLEWWSGH